MSDENVYEMLWDCKFCGTTKLLGKSQKFCPVCGAAQDPKTRYFPSEEDKVAVQDHTYVGADLICPACGSANSGNAEFCTQCGAALENAERASILGQRVSGVGQALESSGPRDLAKERMDADLGRAQAAEKAARDKARRPFIIGGVIAFVVVVIGVIAFLMSTTQTGVLVTGHSWERVINIEDYGPRSESGWRDSVPFDARGVSCSRQQRSTNRVPDGQECRTVQVDRGDGSFSERQECTTKYRDEPVYDDFCNYTVDRWAFERAARSTGASLKDEPYWPETNITRTGECTGCEREGEKQENYTVNLKATDSDKTYDCTFNDQAKWASFGIETLWQMEIRRTGAALCDTLKTG